MVIVRCAGQQLVVAAGEKLIKYDLVTKESQDVNTPEPNLQDSVTKNQVVKKGQAAITCMNVSPDGQYIVLARDNKQVLLYRSDLTLVKNFTSQRLASKVTFTRSNDILVADKTGDVFLYKLSDDLVTPTFLLGHLSMILDVVVSDCGKYVITCDRDEKIRVSCYPNTYNIKSFCLGHKEFVTVVKIWDELLISASGDGTIRVWNYLTGKQLGCINTNDHVQDDNLLKEFSSVMGAEKLAITALPISDMQIYGTDDLIVGVSLHNYNGIQIYKVDLRSYDSVFLKTVECDKSYMSFCLKDDGLFVLNNSSLDYVKILSDEENGYDVDLFYKKYKSSFDVVNPTDVSALYKRKFDTVQEYTERKKKRLNFC